MDRRTLLKSLAAAVAGLTVSAHHRPWHEKGPKTTTTTTTTVPTTVPTTLPPTTAPTTTVPAPTTTTTLRPTGDPVYADRTHQIDPGDNWQQMINGA